MHVHVILCLFILYFLTKTEQNKQNLKTDYKVHQSANITISDYFDIRYICTLSVHPQVHRAKERRWVFGEWAGRGNSYKHAYVRGILYTIIYEILYGIIIVTINAVILKLSWPFNSI